MSKPLRDTLTFILSAGSTGACSATEFDPAEGVMEWCGSPDPIGGMREARHAASAARPPAWHASRYAHGIEPPRGGGRAMDV